MSESEPYVLVQSLNITHIALPVLGRKIQTFRLQAANQGESPEVVQEPRGAFPLLDERWGVGRVRRALVVRFCAETEQETSLQNCMRWRAETQALWKAVEKGQRGMRVEGIPDRGSLERDRDENQNRLQAR